MYKITKGQLITLWVTDISLVIFWGIGIFLFPLMVFYTLGWEKHTSTKFFKLKTNIIIAISIFLALCVLTTFLDN